LSLHFNWSTPVPFDDLDHLSIGVVKMTVSGIVPRCNSVDSQSSDRFPARAEARDFFTGVAPGAQNIMGAQRLFDDAAPDGA